MRRITVLFGSFLVRRPAKGSLLLKQHAGRARVVEKYIPLLDFNKAKWKRGIFWIRLQDMWII